MVRSALTGRTRIGQGPVRFAAFVPAASVVTASLLSALPIVSMSGWYPDFGFLALIAWRLLRSDPWPAWWAAPWVSPTTCSPAAPSACRSRCGARPCSRSTSSTGARCGATECSLLSHSGLGEGRPDRRAELEANRRPIPPSPESIC